MTVIRVESIDRDLIERYLPENYYVTQVWEQSGNTTVEGEDEKLSGAISVFAGLS